MNDRTSMLAVIVNHESTAGALALRDGLAPHVPTWLVDSGSRLSPAERQRFDRCLGNVYYCGLMNVAHAETQRRGAEVLYFICSDIAVDHVPALLQGAYVAFQDSAVALYAPSMNASGHPHMRRQARREAGAPPRAVPFVEGACFAVRRSLLAQVCPIDTRVNALGWGIDVALGYHAWRAGQRAVVDDGVTVAHRGVCGYDTRMARHQRDVWFAQQPLSARWFRWLTGADWVKTRVGWGLARRLRVA